MNRVEVLPHIYTKSPHDALPHEIHGMLDMRLDEIDCDKWMSLVMTLMATHAVVYLCKDHVQQKQTFPPTFCALILYVCYKVVKTEYDKNFNNILHQSKRSTWSARSLDIHHKVSRYWKIADNLYFAGLPLCPIRHVQLYILCELNHKTGNCSCFVGRLELCSVSWLCDWLFWCFTPYR